MIRKKKDKSSQKISENHFRKMTFDEQMHVAKDINAELRESALAMRENKEQKVKWKIV